jgi:transcription antitermination protein NusB
MGRRRDARERALQILFELEYNEAGPEAVLARRTGEAAPGADRLVYSAWLVKGVMARREEIDDLIQSAARNWRVARMGLIDRNILRLAVYEMLEEKTLVPAIVINEAVEIARRFSGEESAVFVNGVLDAVRKARFGDDAPKPAAPTAGAGAPPEIASSAPAALPPTRPQRKSIPEKDSHERNPQRKTSSGPRRAASRDAQPRRRAPKK